MELTIKVCGECAAQKLHRYLLLADAGRLPGYEITLFHGLKVHDRIEIGDRAFLAPYADARKTYGLPEYRGVESGLERYEESPPILCAVVSDPSSPTGGTPHHLSRPKEL